MGGWSSHKYPYGGRSSEWLKSIGDLPPPDDCRVAVRSSHPAPTTFRSYLMVHKEISPSGEVYIYMNGFLLYKKWPKYPRGDGTGILFEKYGIPTKTADRTRGHYR